MNRKGWKFFRVAAKQPDKLLSPYGRNLDWDKPKGARPGKWMKVGDRPLVICRYGLHAYTHRSEVECFKDDVPYVRVFRVEAGPEVQTPYGWDKFVARKMRLLYEVSPVTGRRLNPAKVPSIKRRFKRLRKMGVLR